MQHIVAIYQKIDISNSLVCHIANRAGSTENFKVVHIYSTKLSLQDFFKQNIIKFGERLAKLASPRVTPALVSFVYDSQCLRSLGQRLEAPVLGSSSFIVSAYRLRRGCWAGHAVQASRCRRPPRLRSVGNGAYLVATGSTVLPRRPIDIVSTR